MNRSPWTPRVTGFLLAEALSAVGSFATMVVVWGYAAFEFDASPGQLSLYGLAFAVPGVVLGPVAGSVVDRIGPKETIAASKVLGIVASLALLTVDTFLAMVVLTAVHGTAAAFAQPAIQSMPPRLVDEAPPAPDTVSKVQSAGQCFQWVTPRGVPRSAHKPTRRRSSRPPLE